MPTHTIWDFYAAWRHAEHTGRVDGWAGAQCRRRHAEWVRDGCPEPGVWLAAGDPRERAPDAPRRIGDAFDAAYDAAGQHDMLARRPCWQYRMLRSCWESDGRPEPGRWLAELLADQ